MCERPFSDTAPRLLKASDREVDQHCCGVIGWEAAACFVGFSDDPIEAFDGVGNRKEDTVAHVRPPFSDQGVCCEHPGHRHREHESVGRCLTALEGAA